MAEIHSTHIHQTDSVDITRDGSESETGFMDKRRRQSFWDFMNLRIAVINALIVAVIGIASVYTTNLLTQQALANRVDTIEAVNAERMKRRDADFDELKDALKNDVVTKEVLKLYLDPIVTEQKKQRDILEQIRDAAVRSNP